MYWNLLKWLFKIVVGISVVVATCNNYWDNFQYWNDYSMVFAILIVVGTGVYFWNAFSITIEISFSIVCVISLVIVTNIHFWKAFSTTNKIIIRSPDSPWKHTAMGWPPSSSVVNRALTCFSQELLDQSLSNLLFSICKVRRHEIRNFLTTNTKGACHFEVKNCKIDVFL